MVGTLKETAESQRGKVLSQSAKVIRNILHELHVQTRKGPVLFEKRARGGIFCMSGPVAHVDDDDDGDDEEEEEAEDGDDEDQLCSPEQAAHLSDLSLCRREKSFLDVSAVEHNSREFLGVKTLPNGDIYVGSWQGALPEGTGKYLWSDGCMYEGEWGKGEKSGKGKISWPSGATYEGDFMGGYMHGMGTYTSIDGTTYKGSWYMNENHGFGRKSYAHGDVYEGSWKRGVAEGPGRYIWKNGSEYMGDWKGGLMCGRGVLTWVNGDKYDGQWLDGLEHGHGVYTWADGSTYIGTWSRGLKDGKGTFYPPGSNCLEARSLSSHWLASREEHDVPVDELFASRNSSRPQNLSALSTEQCIARVQRRSSRGSSAENVTWSEISTSSDNPPEKSCSFERSWSSEGSLERTLPHEVRNVWSNSGDSIIEIAERNPTVEQATVHLPIVEREYVQGVLINEIRKESLARSSIRPPRRRHKYQMKEPKRPGETIFKGHRSYDLMLNLQLGIRYTVGKMTPESRREISPTDFGPKSRIWMNFPKEGSQLTPPHQSVDFKWKDYCPLVFRHLRALFKIDAADYMLSICGNDGLRELSSPGKSGSVFYVSHDDRFMIKTMRKAEVKALLGMLPNYYNHVRTYENTLITKFFGLHRIKPAFGQKVRFVVMGNMFCSELRIHRRFDLKGSSQGRSADKVEIDENTTLKDLDLDFVFHLDPAWRDALLKQVHCDCKFLETERIMDYSLLLGVHFRAPQFPTVFSRGTCPVVDMRLPETVGFTKWNDAGIAEEDVTRKGLVVADYESEQDDSAPGPYIWGSPLRTAAAEDEEADLLLPGAARLCIQLGVNMPARADRRPKRGKDGEDLFFGGAYDVVLYFGIIDILQEYDISKKLEHAYKSFQFDSLSISAVDPSIYSKRFKDFVCEIFPANL